MTNFVDNRVDNRVGSAQFRVRSKVPLYPKTHGRASGIGEIVPKRPWLGFESQIPIRQNNQNFVSQYGSITISSELHGRHLRYLLSFALTMDVTELPSVAASVERLRKLLHRASKIKPKPDIEPPLPISEYSGEQGLPSGVENKSSQHAVIEVAARKLFLQFLTNSSSVDDAEFVHMWNLLDILNILGDQGT